MSGNDNMVAVGIDVGSLCARVSISSSKNDLSVVSNSQGHRSTPALVVKEDHSGEKPSKKQEQEVFVFGEAAQRLLHKAKIDVETRSMRTLLLQEEEDEGSDAATAVSAFLGHLITMASDATSTTDIAQLRLVLSVPVDSSNEFIDKYVSAMQAAIQSKLDSKTKKKKEVASSCIVGVLTDAAAVCVAHGLTMSNNNNETNKDDFNRILVVNWGASGLTASEFHTCSGTSKMLSLQRTKRDDAVSGPAFVQVLAKFIASQFERKHRIPSGEVWENKKARTKLIQACVSALQTMSANATSGGSSQVHVTIDGLYEGMDCHLPISKPRWDMLTSSLFQKAQTLLEGFSSSDASLQPNVILMAGSVCHMSNVSILIDKVFPNSSIIINKGVPPDEAVALGCARHALHVLEMMESHKDATGIITHHRLPTSNVPTSPIAIGISPASARDANNDETKADDDNMILLLGQGTPLPAHVTHTFVVDGSSENKSYALWQLNPKKVVAKLEDLPSGEVELLMELSSNGALSMAVQGGPLVRVE